MSRASTRIEPENASGLAPSLARSRARGDAFGDSSRDGTGGGGAKLCGVSGERRGDGGAAGDAARVSGRGTGRGEGAGVVSGEGRGGSSEDGGGSGDGDGVRDDEGDAIAARGSVAPSRRYGGPGEPPGSRERPAAALPGPCAARGRAGEMRRVRPVLRSEGHFSSPLWSYSRRTALYEIEERRSEAP